MKMSAVSGLSLELAGIRGRSDTLDTWLDKFEEDLVNDLLLNSLEPDWFEQGPGNELSSYLDTNSIELDGNLQFLRLPENFSGTPSWKVIKYRCQLAIEAESFYRCISVQEQWLRTVIQPHKQNVHSNVVPRQAYLTRLTGTKPICPGLDLCTRGFFPTNVLLREAEPPRPCCGNCNFVEQLKGGAHMASAVVRFWEFQNESVIKSVDGHARLGEGSSDGEVEKILWRKGIFVRKRFNCAIRRQNLHFSREIFVAMNVTHPNIVHYFGYSLWPDSAEYCDLFMELLEMDLEKFLLEGARTGDRLAFRDVLEVLLQVAEAMRHLHEKNFLHGDLKPGNIFMSRLAMPHSDAQFHLVKVADFGCAQPVDPNSGATCEPFDFKIGTLHYTAPEVLRCRRPGGAPIEHPQKIDVYSFGVVAYQVLTGVAKVYPKDLRNIRNKVIDGTLRPDYNLNLQTLDDDGSSLLPFIQNCWAATPNERPSFAEICQKLESLTGIKDDRGKNGKRKSHSLSEVLEKPMKALCFSNNDSRCTG
ncbi:hypothetical protein M758_11G062000 [Ceratodon purpureus]|nr:hypothetical protein M758_11G062000 [Ceratodon purpureus]